MQALPQSDSALLSRRRVLAGLASAGVAMSLRGGAVHAAAAPGERIVDVHAHYYPPVLKALGTPGPMNAWSLQKHLEEMDAAGVSRSLLSLTTPGIAVQGEEGRKLMRESNEWAAKTCGEHRGKLGFFTCVQLEDTEGSLKEIEHGFDVLNAQGVGLFTSYGKRWLGDPAFDPVFAELERRKAIVYVHPTSAACCGGLIPGVFDTLIEYGTDTTRAIASYIYRGAARRFPNVKMIWSHSGGTMPFLIERFDGADRAPDARAEAPDGFRAAASKFFYDIAQASNPVATTALRSVVPVDHIVFGTDYPFRTPLEHVEALQAAGVFKRAELQGVYRANVEKFLPALVSG
jgi:predicted TIM-barrel fold metal-dependent hydrolase